MLACGSHVERYPAADAQGLLQQQKKKRISIPRDRTPNLCVPVQTRSTSSLLFTKASTRCQAQHSTINYSYYGLYKVSKINLTTSLNLSQCNDIEIFKNSKKIYCPPGESPALCPSESPPQLPRTLSSGLDWLGLEDHCTTGEGGLLIWAGS